MFIKHGHLVTQSRTVTWSGSVVYLAALGGSRGGSFDDAVATPTVWQQ